MQQSLEIVPLGSSPVGVSFLVGKLGADVGPLKQARELIVNAFEAIGDYRLEYPEDTAYQPRVFVYADPWLEKHEGIRKIAYADNGIGMTPDQIVLYFGSIAESGKVLATDRNFGVGAKIATAVWNPVGVEIRSWKHGQGALARLIRDPQSGLYGLERHALPDGRVVDVLTQDDSADLAEMKPNWISTHGTVVVLYGKEYAEDTTVAPDTSEITHRDYWFTHVANRQFFEIPHGIQFASQLTFVDGKPHKRSIEGYRKVVEDDAVDSSDLDIGEAVIHWYIMDEKKNVERYRKRPYYHVFSGYTHHGHVAAVYGGELFDFTGQLRAIPLLQKFGIFAGYDNVALYVEPKRSMRVTANLTRTNLVLPDGTGLPWDAWADIFYQNMPDALKHYVESKQSLTEHSERDFVKDEVRKYLQYVGVRQLRAHPSGTVKVEETTEEDIAKPASGSGGRGGKPSPIIRPRRPALRFTEGGSTSGVEAALERVPQWEWKTSDEAGILDRAARYIPERNFLTIASDFSVFLELVEEGLSLVIPEHRGTAQEDVARVVRRLYALQLVWTVMNATASFKNRRYWSTVDFKALVSEEGLTAAVLPRTALIQDIRRRVKSMPSLGRYLIKGTPDAA